MVRQLGMFLSYSVTPRRNQLLIFESDFNSHFSADFAPLVTQAFQREEFITFDDLIHPELYQNLPTVDMNDGQISRAIFAIFFGHYHRYRCNYLD